MTNNIRSVAELARRVANFRIVDTVLPVDEHHITLLKLQGYQPSTVSDHWYLSVPGRIE